MKNEKFEKLKRFQKALEKGKSGMVKSFDIWLKNYGLDSKKAQYEFIKEYFLENSHRIVNREKEIEQIAEFIGFYLKNRKYLYHLPILGIKGSGKSLLLSTIRDFLDSVEGINGVKKYDASKFGEQKEGTEELNIHCILEELDSRIDVIIIDSCENDDCIEYSLNRVTRKTRKGVYITSWSSERWNSLRDRIENFLPTAKEINIEPLKKEDTKNLIYVIIEITAEKKTEITEITEDVADSIYFYSKGIPFIAIKLFLTALKETYLKQKQAMNKKSIEAAAARMSLLDIPEKLRELSDQQVVILKHILLSHDERGVRPKELVEYLDRDKATISYHLTTLKSLGLLDVERVGRSSFYRIKEYIEPFVQLRIMEERDYYV